MNIEIISGGVPIRLAITLEELAKLVALTGNRWVDLREASKITGRKQPVLVAAYKAKHLAHHIHKGKPQFKVSDLWAWMDLTRVEAKQ